MATVPAASLTDVSPRTAPVSRFSEMSSEDFIRVIFTELSNQDPLQPNDSSALLQQMESIRSIESDMQLTRKLESLVLQNQMAGASTMLGKVVRGMTAEHDPVFGVAVAMVREGDVVSLELDNGYRVPVSSILEVIDPQMFQPSSATPPSASVPAAVAADSAA